MIFEKHMLPLAFKNSICKNRESQIFLSLLVICIFIQFFIFQRFYPFPNFLPDSYSYIEAAKFNSDVNIWPIGYSKFLRLLSVFNHTGKGLFFTQYVILEASITFFIFTIGFLMEFKVLVLRIFSVTLVLNPLLLYVSNFVSSDAIFTSLSLLWLSTLCWILYYPNKDLYIVHSILLLFSFSVRYNALYYPVFTIGIVLLLKLNFRIKFLYLFLIFTPLLGFIANTTWIFYKNSNSIQFSPFGGWQLASNAMYMYSHVVPRSPRDIPLSFRRLHYETIHHMDSLNRINFRDRPDLELGTYYLWDGNAPLKKYLKKYYVNDSISSYLNKWSEVAPLYSRYGFWLIKNYPGEFVKYYVYPNLVNYYSPSTEFLSVYNMGEDTIEQGAVEWFKYSTNKVQAFSKDNKITITKIFPALLAGINVLFFLGFIGFWYLNGHRKLSVFQLKIYILFLLVWCTNFLFSVLASPIVLRYQIYPFIFTLTFVIMIFQSILNKGLISTTKISDDEIIR